VEKATMKIAQIAPLMESVPPRLYGGTERVVSHLTEELVRLGHDVTLFATGDSITSASLISCATVALRLDPNVIDPIPYYMLMLDRVRRRASEFDILHFHIDYLHFPLFRYLAGRTVTTLHGRQDLPDIKPFFLGFDEMPLVSISHAQRSPVANANFAATIHHGPAAKLDAAKLRTARRLFGFYRTNIAREAAGSCDCYCPESWHPAKDCGQG
jgi:glycosyltransferase involved in cell wall biosynthesis